MIARTDSSNSESESSESSSDEGSNPEFEEDCPTPKAVAVEVDGAAASSGPESRSFTGSSQTLPSIRGSGDSGSDSEASASADDSTSASDPDNDSASDSDDIPNTDNKLVQTGRKAAVVKATDTPATGPPRELDAPTAVTKRRRANESGGSVTTSTILQPKTPNLHKKGNTEGQPRKINTPFSRIKADEIKFADDRLKDNTFQSRKATANDYGTKASADLIVTRGASFRKEKNKKKRGSYRGGDITVCKLLWKSTLLLIPVSSRWKAIASSLLIKGKLSVIHSCTHCSHVMYH